MLYIDDSMIEKVRSLSTYINYKYNRAANVLIENLPLPVDVDVGRTESKRKRNGSQDRSERSTPDLEVSFPLIDSSPMTSYTSSPNTSNSSIQNCSGGKYGKKRKLRLHGDSEKHSQLVEQLVSLLYFTPSQNVEFVSPGEKCSVGERGEKWNNAAIYSHHSLERVKPIHSAVV